MARGDDSDLLLLGLRAGDRVRWRPRPGAHFEQGVVTGRERDGSVGVRDGAGRSRALLPERLEVRGRGRARARWEPVVVVAARTEQLELFPRS